MSWIESKMESKMKKVFTEFQIVLQQIVEKYPEEKEFIEREYRRIYNQFNSSQSIDGEMEVEQQNEVSFQLYYWLFYSISKLES